MTGRHEVKRVQIEPAVVGEDREMLEDLIAAAINDAVHRRRSATQAKMAGRDGRPVAAARQSSCRSEAADRPSMKHSPALAALIEALRTLPGVGPKSAQRMAFHLLQRGAPGARRRWRSARCRRSSAWAAAAAAAC